MRTIRVLIGIMLGMGVAGAAAGCAVEVRLSNTALAAPGVVSQAKWTAGAIFARIGVKLAWTSGGSAPSCGNPIEIRLEAGDPGAERPDSLAYAMPYLGGGTSIHVFVERVVAMAPASRTGVVLGHVLAHEITHVLERSTAGTPPPE